MDELTTFVVGIDFPNEDKSKSNRRMECMLCVPGDVVELRLEPTNPFDNNAVAILSERGPQLGYVSAERAPLIGKRMKEGEANAVFQAMHGSGAYIRIRFGAGCLPCPTRPPMFQCARLPAKRGRRSDRFMIPTRSIQMMTVQNLALDSCSSRRKRRIRLAKILQPEFMGDDPPHGVIKPSG